jgi:prepilin-type N-terminal cleavage/methylation domain-containing protein
MTRRRGYSLVELLVVISVTAVLMAIFALLAGMLLRLDRTGNAVMAGRETVGRLSSRFRADAHAATSVHEAPAEPPAPAKPVAQPAAGAAKGKPGASDPTAGAANANKEKPPVEEAGEADLILEISPERSVRYHIQNGALLRVVLERGVLKQQELFGLPQRGLASFAVSTREGHQFVALTIQGRVRLETERPARALTIEAAVGRDHRYEAGREP